MSRVQDSGEPATRARGGGKFDVKPGVVVIPVSETDTGTAYYAGPGSRLDADVLTDGDLRVVEVTPPGSPRSMIFGRGVTYGPRPVVSREPRIGRNWQGRYAAYMVSEQAEEGLPS
jgi:hypothetical protein